MFAKFHNTLQDSSYESRKKEKKKREKNYQQNLQSIIQTWPRVAIDIRSLVTKTMHISQLLRCPHCHLQQSCRQGTRGSEDERIGRVNRLSSLGNGRYRSIMPFWSNDRGLVSTRSRTDTSRVDGSSTGNRSLLTGICVSGPALFHISKVVVSLSLSRLDLSLLSRFWLAFALIIANPKMPMREILPRRTISSLHDLRGILVIRSHTFLGGSLLCWLLVNRVESRPALGSLIPMARWLGRQRVAPGLGVVPR